jgi:cell division transport system permease protein
MAERRDRRVRTRRASRADRIGLKAAMADRLLPFMVAAMSFLASLALAGSIAAAAIATHWLGSAQGILTVEVPDPATSASPGGPSRAAAVLAALRSTPGVTEAHRIGKRQVTRLLKPWLGSDTNGGSLPIALPAIMLAQVAGDGTGTGALAGTLEKLAPGTLVDSGARWATRLGALTGSLRASAAAVLLVVAFVAASVVAVAVRAGLAQRREAIEIIHGLGALDSDIANQFARRAMRLAGLGGASGALVALPVLVWLAHLSAAFVAAPRPGISSLLPPALWASPVIFTLVTALIGWFAAQITVRGWLKRLI